MLTKAASSLLFLATLGLVVAEIFSPGVCPDYPLIGVPACYVMVVLFGLITFLVFTKYNYSRHLFYPAWLIAFISSLYFSYGELANIQDCPRAFGIPIPLCFLVPPSLALILWLKKNHK
ncbi:MAG: hypothetical protein AAF413_00570 [Patescibacteria group bacterium]